MSKYGNQKVILDGIIFDSKREASRWVELKYMQRAHLIQDLERQVQFIVIPAQKDPDTGKVIEKACKYVADFTYHENGDLVVEDAKGVKTESYRIKKKLMLKEYGIRIREV